MKTIEIEAKTDNLGEVTAFVDTLLEENGCPMKIQMQVELTVEEIFVNIASYAYPSGTGMAEITAGIAGDPAVLTIIFRDSGTPYDPLAKEDPDVTLSASERRIGGLGVFLVKKNMDDVSYEYREGKNVLTVSKKISL